MLCGGSFEVDLVSAWGRTHAFLRKTSLVTQCVIDDKFRTRCRPIEDFAMNVVVREKVEYHQQTSQRMDKHFVVPEWSVRQKLALACRILAADGHDSGLAGQLSARADAPGRDHMLQFGLGLEEITPENLLTG